MNLKNSVLVYRGNLILLTQQTGNVALDTSGKAEYSDLAWQKTIWSQLSSFQNNRFYFTTINDFIGYEVSFNLMHSYEEIGSYNLSVTFAQSNQIYSQIIEITDCNFI